MAGGRSLLRKAAMLLALCAGGLGASVPSPAKAPAWQADPDEQFILDVNIHQLRLGDTVRAYTPPEGTCVVLGDFLTALDVPMRIDLGAKRASGWAFKERNKITIDYGALRVSYGAGKTEAITPGAIRETPEGWCVQTSALMRWFGIGVKPVTSGSVLVLSSDEKLPVELAMERQKRAAQSAPRQLRSEELAPGSGPLSHVAGARARLRRQRRADLPRHRRREGRPRSSVYAAGEIAHLSYDAQVTTTDERKAKPVAGAGIPV